MSRDVTVNRRGFLAGSAAVAAGAGLATPAIAQSRIEWDMVTAWPTGAPGVDDNARRIAQQITDLSDGRIVINVHGAGEIVPAFGVFDAVSQDVAQMYHAVPAYWTSKNKAIGLFGSFPFGFTAPEQMGWMYHGGGYELYDKIYDSFGLKGFIAGNSGPQFFGWFRNEINTLDDLHGLRIRTTGFGGEMLRKVGVAVVSLPGGEIFQALQAGTIDAGEFIGPWNDFAFGFHQVAQNYYAPGPGEPSSAEEIGINAAAYNDLPEDLRQIITTVAAAVSEDITTGYDINHARALKTMVEEHDVQVRMLSDEIVAGLAEATKEIVQELLDDSDETVREVMASYASYRNETATFARYSYAAQMNARTFDFPEA
ncbi:TRAP transporter substrate-binding protein [Aquibaculum arenosum]|uniref:TRAP transporter substrate-binding protein n=1 Tax=Aquibaculum arenosum TaxID=3032591 RepID=A0ABT5YIN4_9PROT|nr:TRAP transporter substrate-binding protein [Fodinicurvata sp. CAU 1616]MDF2094801.1 TRAP transporter substrate-binding protein [Fodinicurvata sp. CAU 1616]